MRDLPLDFEFERCHSVWHGLAADGSSHLLTNALANVKPESNAIRVHSLPGVQTSVRLEQLFEVSGRNPRAPIGHLDLQHVLAWALIDVHVDTGASGGEFDGVGQEIHRNLLDVRPV